MTLTDAEIQELGSYLYEQLLPSVQTTHFGEYIAIEPISKEWFIGKTAAEAIAKARERYPDRRFFIAKIGERKGALGWKH